MWERTGPGSLSRGRSASEDCDGWCCGWLTGLLLVEVTLGGDFGASILGFASFLRVKIKVT